MQHIELMTRSLLMIIFISAAVFKIIDISLFKRTLVQVQIAERWSPFLAYVIVGFESLAGLLVFAGVDGPAFVLIALLCCGFVYAAAVSMAGGRDVRCHCFGALSAGRLGLRTVALSIVLVALALWVVWFGSGVTIIRAPEEGAAALFAVAGAVAVAALLVRLKHSFANGPR